MFTSLKAAYRAEVATEKNNAALWSGNLNQSRPISELPQVLQQYLYSCGYDGSEGASSYKLTWQDAFLKLAPGKEWSSVVCQQYNFIPMPARIVYIKTKLWRIFQLEAKDRYQNGRGNMLVKLIRLFKVTDSSGPEMDVAELVTILAEAIIFPVYFLQNYISLQVINSCTIKATIKDNGIKASGTFYFNAFGDFIAFETFDRYYSKNGKYYKTRWTTHVDSYTEVAGIRFPAKLRAVWHLPGGEYEYFKATIAKIKSYPENLVKDAEQILVSEH